MTTFSCLDYGLKQWRLRIAGKIRVDRLNEVKVPLLRRM